MLTAADILVNKLTERQRERRLSDAAFADLLMVSRQLWLGTRSGTVELGLGVMSGTIRAFPDLRDDVMNAVAEYRTRKADRLGVA